MGDRIRRETIDGERLPRSLVSRVFGFGSLLGFECTSPVLLVAAIPVDLSSGSSGTAKAVWTALAVLAGIVTYRQCTAFVLVNDRGVTVRGVWLTRTVSWDAIRAVTLTRVVLGRGFVRAIVLTCKRRSDLALGPCTHTGSRVRRLQVEALLRYAPRAGVPVCIAPGRERYWRGTGVATCRPDASGGPP